MAGGNEFQRIRGFGPADQFPAPVYAAGIAAHFDARLGRQADEGIAAETLAALHRLEQIGIGLVGQLEVNGKRGIEIREGFEHNRDAVESLRGELREFLLSHDELLKLRKRDNGNDVASDAAPGRRLAPPAPTGPNFHSQVLKFRRVHERASVIRSSKSGSVGTIASQSSSCTVSVPR